MSVIDTLLENDPNTDLVLFHLKSPGAPRWYDSNAETSDVGVAEALLQNTYVRKVYIYVLGGELDEWPMLRRALATHGTLKKVVFVNEIGQRGSWAGDLVRHSGNVSSVVLPFLKAAYSNASVKTIGLHYFRLDLTTELFSFLCKEYEGKVLDLYRCNTAKSVAEHLVGQMLGSGKIQDMEVRKCGEGLAGCLVRSAGQNFRLRSLKLSIYQLVPVSQMSFLDIDVVRFLRSTQSVRKFVLHVSHVPVQSRDTVKEELLESVKQNFSLRSVIVKVQERLWFGGVNLSCRKQESIRLGYYSRV